MNFKEYICSASRALLGFITPNVRGVQFDISKQQTIDVIFYYDSVPSDKELKLKELTKIKLLADYPSREVNCISKTSPCPEKLPLGNDLYYRYEQ